ncbi:DUF427 domain-containing protein [Kitasatospora azatica]|uniref:DUF427 domain-containing protein n=1 Tax=Kitasatospora azatica TaxID=58347 RepID=UPI00055F2447|nr:DUF427 domain-containing protein [Kitasatospora azatica]
MTTSRGSVRTEPSAKRVRVYLGGQVVADSSHPLLVWESPHYPTYYFAAADVDQELLAADGKIAHSPSRGDAQKYTVKVGAAQAPGAALHYEESPIEELRGHYRFDWDAMDAWFEEDEEVFVHPRSPYTRIDVLPSSRHIRVEVDGVTVAESRNARLLFETGLPTRYYFPKTHVRMDLLEPTDTVSHCPYKGTAEYWSVRVGDEYHRDLAWSYRTALPESQRAAGLIAFWKADIYVDGVLQEGPKRG